MKTEQQIIDNKIILFSHTDWKFKITLGLSDFNEMNYEAFHINFTPWFTLISWLPVILMLKVTLRFRIYRAKIMQLVMHILRWSARHIFVPSLFEEVNHCHHIYNRKILSTMKRKLCKPSSKRNCFQSRILSNMLQGRILL